MKIENYGKGERCLLAMRYLLLDERLSHIENIERLILLPIPSARDGVHITGTDKLISELLMDINPHDLVVGYNIPAEDKDVIIHSGGDFLDVSLDEKFTLDNAELSALGALGYILTSIKEAPLDSKYGIIGYGRIGKRLCEMLMYLGGYVRVYSSSNMTRLTLSKYGVDNLSYDKDAHCVPEIDDIDILINTAPTHLESTFKNHKVPEHMRVIELASGENFKGVEGITSLQSIPENFYPKSAALIYYKAIMRAILGGDE